MRRQFAALVALCLAGATLAGCALGPEGIFRTKNLEKADNIVVTDAKQRLIISRQPEPNSRPGLVAPHAIVCAEPSPDVATTLAGSVGTSLSVFGYGSGGLSVAQAEGMAQLAERTASIQLMRDQMYRACEAYANGAITGTNYTLLMSEITDTMVTLLMGETAGGAFGRSLSALGSKASAEASASQSGLPDLMGNVQQSTQQLADAEVEVSKAQQDLTDANAALAKLPDDKDAQKAVETKKAALEAAKGKRDALRDSLQSHLDAATKAAGEISNVTAAGSIASKPDAAVAGVLSEMQRNFINRDPSYTLIQACLVELGMWNANDQLSQDARDRYKDFIAKEKDLPLYDTKLNYFINQTVALNENTGLYAFCRDRLPAIAPSIIDYNAQIEMARTDNERRNLDLQLISARAKAASDIANALTRCEQIPDPTAKEACKSTVFDLGHQGMTVGTTPEALPGNVTPTLAYDRAGNALADLNGTKAALDALAAIPAAVPAGKPATESQRADLAARRTQIGTAVQALTTQVSPDLTADKRTQLADIERAQTDLLGKLQIGPTDGQQKALTDQLQAKRAQAKALEGLYNQHAATLNDLVGTTNKLIAEIKQFLEAIK